MDHFSVRRSALAVAALSLVTMLVACEDKRVSQLDSGITRDSALNVMQRDLKPGAGSDSFPNVYTRHSYLINSKHIEVLYFTPNNEKAGKDTIPLRKLSPIVFVDNRLIGKGWPFWDSVAAVNKIQVPPKQ